VLGEGTTSTSLQHVFFTFRRLLSPTYVVLPLSADALLKEPWQGTCAALIIPGGADLPYCRSLNGKGNQRIKQFIQSGGRYIGLCAGGYYGSSKCEFMEGHPVMEVVGHRELQLFPGTCRGLAYKGFIYQSEANAKAVDLAVNPSAFKGIKGVPEFFKSYYHGGGVFVDAPKFEEQGVEVLANYCNPLDCESGEGTAAIVYRRIGEGAALLTGPHPE
jgi:biotin--protein ligase